MLKIEARKIYKQKRKEISLIQKEKWDDLLLIHFQKLNLPFITTVFSYIAIVAQKEIDCTNMIRYLQFVNPELKIAYPVCNFADDTMKAIVANDDTDFKVNSYGILEPAGDTELNPAAVDLVLLPLLCFDKYGYRVGYGKGFYDKFLAACRQDVIKIGLSYFEPIDEITDRDEFDIPLNYCVTPQVVYEF